MRSLRFSLGPFPVTVQPSFFFIALIVALGGWSLRDTVILTASAFFSVLVHELAHAVAFRAFGRASTITLYAMGGVTSAPGPALSPTREIVTSLVGPLTGIVIGAPLFLVESDLLRLIGVINLTWAAFNLLPILPLDGGQAMRALIERFAPGRGDVAAPAISIAAAALIAIIAFRMDYTIAAALTAYFGVMNISDLVTARSIRTDGPQLGRAADLLSAGHADEALAICDRMSTRKGVAPGAREAALEIGAWARVTLDRAADARATIERFAPSHAPGDALLGALDLLDGSLIRGIERIANGLQEDTRLIPVSLGALVARVGATDDLLARVAHITDAGARGRVQSRLQVMLHVAGRYEESATLGRTLLAGSPDATAGYNLACSLARLGETTGAMEALQQAVFAGFTDAEGMRADPDLEAVRADPRFDSAYATALRNAGSKK